MTRPKISKETVDEIWKRFEEGASLRQVEEEFRVGRWTSKQIREGTHPHQQTGDLKRCKTCGGMVVMPCMVCSSQELRRLYGQKP
ncbi:helix-turn-helix domain-containing protein [Blastopirellula retiformator]|uniref:Uncharacterized protein n=1 Tax=Blastopirellula retiformator TaxID=2527970 RepID=A0A5C5UWG7_9BACT|nr:hypothetical protein [Blastopirellula retiformator]TWT30691.1 hypothetical protein Enr8_42140 [Blastopirellula retiformator]